MSKKFERNLAQATDSTILETNWDAVLECVDSIRGGEVPAKSAMAAVQKRMTHENPHVCIHTLVLLEAIVKNCGKKVHSEVATRDFMEDFKNLAFESKAEQVKNKVLELLQCWAMAFAAKSEYKIIVDTHNLMKLAGFEFPSIKESEAMFAAQVAPEWEDGNECFRCRTDFGIITRKHHCRACGQIFCNACSSKEMLLPQFGIEKPVRVCDGCFEKGVGVAVGRPGSTVRTKKHIVNHQPSQGNEMFVIDQAPAQEQPNRQKRGFFGRMWGRKTPEPQPTGAAIGAPSTAQQPDVSAEEKERILREKEEEELQLAIALSQSEAEAKEADRQKSLYSIYNGVKGDLGNLNLTDATIVPSEVTIPSGYKGIAESVRDSPSDGSMATDDPLARYLNRDYWQQRKTNAEAKVEQWDINPSAPLPSEPSVGGSCAPTIRGSPVPAPPIVHKESVGYVTAAPLLDDDIRQKSEDTTKFCDDIRDQVESMENRIRSNTARGRPIFNDTAIQGLYMRLTELHAQVMQRMTDFDNQRTYFESLQDKLSAITEARAALNEIREEEERNRAALAAEQQRQQQAQMQQKLAVMRQQKHEMLIYQRQVALQRFQQQEAEMAARRQQMQHQPQQGYYGQYQPVTSIAQPASLYNATPCSQAPPPAYGYNQQFPGYAGYGQQQSHSLPHPTQTTSNYTPVDQQHQQNAQSVNSSPYANQTRAQDQTPSQMQAVQQQVTHQNGYSVATSAAYAQQQGGYTQNGQQSIAQPMQQQHAAYQVQSQALAQQPQSYAGYTQQSQYADPSSQQQQIAQQQQPAQQHYYQQQYQPAPTNSVQPQYVAPSQQQGYVQAPQPYAPAVAPAQPQPVQEELLISFD